ncbi:MAG: hypothetical protein IPI81_01420 [Flavobacteriales bacterium]|nr:hypothetical protein [Flavobacteriales bacterium]MCC6939936.1 hypothetical protein [Flavobacteriales bacterium]
MFQSRIILISVLIAATMNANAQSDTTEFACDTTVFGHHYTLCITDQTGHPVEFGNRNDEGQRHGSWCELRGDGTDRAQGEYKNDKRIGTWWASRHEIWKYNRKGEIISKGKACRDCPTF